MRTTLISMLAALLSVTSIAAVAHAQAPKKKMPAPTGPAYPYYMNCTPENLDKLKELEQGMIDKFTKDQKPLDDDGIKGLLGWLGEQRKLLDQQPESMRNGLKQAYDSLEKKINEIMGTKDSDPDYAKKIVQMLLEALKSPNYYDRVVAQKLLLQMGPALLADEGFQDLLKNTTSAEQSAALQHIYFQLVKHLKYHLPNSREWLHMVAKLLMLDQKTYDAMADELSTKWLAFKAKNGQALDDYKKLRDQIAELRRTAKTDEDKAKLKAMLDELAAQRAALRKLLEADGIDANGIPDNDSDAKNILDLMIRKLAKLLEDKTKLLGGFGMSSFAPPLFENLESFYYPWPNRTPEEDAEFFKQFQTKGAPFKIICVDQLSRGAPSTSGLFFPFVVYDLDLETGEVIVTVTYSDQFPVQENYMPKLTFRLPK